MAHMFKQWSIVERDEEYDSLNFEENLLTKVAWYYYKDQLTQQEIASLLHISRNKVVRLLDKARSEGIVTFHVKGTGLHCLSIERDLMKNST